MDTDDLSQETYAAVMETAVEFHHDLISEFGVLAEDCENDDDFLNVAEELIKEWLEERDLEDVLEYVFVDDLPSKEEFHQVLQKLLNNISLVRQIPIEKRRFDFD